MNTEQHRIIKFRVWYPKYREMDSIESLYFFEENSIDTIPEDTDRMGMVIMQFTGMLDKHDKEIYEGDILRVNGGEPGFEFISQIIFACGAFRVEKAYGQGFPYREDMEIIGNIYENPELLDE